MSPLRRMFSFVWQIFVGILSSGRLWGVIRLVITLGIGFLFVSWGRFIWNESGSRPASLVWWWGLRFWVMPIMAIVAAFLMGGHYSKRLHMLHHQKMPLASLLASCFSVGIPTLVVKDGRPELKAGQENSIATIGGPGWLNVYPGSAVVVETLQKPTRVFGAGLHWMTRLERVREYISLADQHGMTEQVTAATKDGIEINAKRINYRYRLQTGRQPRDYRRRTIIDPYPFSASAARKLAYQRTAFANGSLTVWDRVVKNGVDGVITDFLNANQFDFATTPLPENDPRLTIINQMNARSLRDRLRTTGTELLWFDIGEFEPKLPEIDLQRIKTWGARWSGEAAIEVARGDARRLSAEELARAEAQAELLTSIVRSLEDSGLLDNSQQNIRQIIVVRIAQLLETMVESNPMALDRDVPAQPPSVTARRWRRED